jgi:type III secretory pathway component EscR
MFFSSFLISILLSLCLIISLHYLWDYLKDTYSTTKTKDLVNTQIEKYKMLVNESVSKKDSFLTEEEKQSMNEELMNFANNFSNTSSLL